jgi:NADH:ubiquinone oxidoreductase subunit F (NADH-binding)
MAPAVVVNEQPASAGDLDGLVEAARNGGARAGRGRPSGRDWATDPYVGGAERYALVRRLLGGELTSQAVIAALEGAELRGMGGAGFPTGRKWSLVAGVEADQKHVICNADESEPGTFKDRQILAEVPHLLVEGMLLGMLVVGAEEGIVFVRHEYGPETAVVRAELEAARALGVLGADVLGTGRRLEIEVVVSPGGYILGEETALLECLEGHRGEPRNKPPFPGVHGLWGRPTLINNVETFAHVPVIVTRGADWWREQGVRGAVGLKAMAVSGHVARPGVHVVPLGTTVEELIEIAGGMRDGATLLAFTPGGASSNFLLAADADVPLDFKPMADRGSMLGSGALVAIAEGTDLLAAATNVLRFFRNESCGRCVPCRTGTQKAVRILDELVATGGGPADVDERIPQLEETLRLTSICGLGQVALGPVMSVLRLAGAPVLADGSSGRAD